MWSNVLKSVLAWRKNLGWRRASKCKQLSKNVQLHLTIQKNRRETIIRQSRADIAQYLQTGRLQQALTRVEQLYKDLCLVSAYDQINQLCECIITNISHISNQSNLYCLPIDVSQAVSDVIFASSRCGDLPGLHKLRSLFKERYGCKFEIDNVELLPGNLVNSQLKENLCVNSVPDYVKRKLINDIAEEYTLHLGFQDVRQSLKPQSQQKAEVLDLDIQDICSDSDEGSISIPASKFKTPTKIGSHNNVSEFCSTNSSGSRTKFKTNRALIEKQETSSTSTSSYGTSLILETSIVYLDGMKSNSLNPEDSNGRHASAKSMDSWNRSASSGSISNVKKKPGKPRLQKKSESPETELPHFSIGAPLSNNHDPMLVKNRHSLDSSMDKWNMQSHSNSGSCHVHSKLPNYEVVVAKLTDLRTEQMQRKSFYY